MFFTLIVGALILVLLIIRMFYFTVEHIFIILWGVWQPWLAFVYNKNYFILNVDGKKSNTTLEK